MKELLNHLYEAKSKLLAIAEYPEDYEVINGLSEVSVNLTELHHSLSVAVAVIEDYLVYQHNGDPWVEDARLMGEMEINDYGRDGRLARAKELLKCG